MAGMYTLTSPLLDDDYDEQHTAALAALAAETPDLNPMSQLAPPAPTPVADLIDYSQPEPEPFPVAATSALATANTPPPAPAPDPISAAPAAAAPDPFEALMRQGQAQRQQALDSYGESEPGVNGWAVLADVLFNKGKSIPGIISQADNDKRAWRDGRAKLLTGGGHNDPVSQMLAMERIKTGQGNLAARTHGQESREEALRKEGEADVLAGDRFRQYATEKGFYDPSMEGLGGKALAKQFPMRREDKTLALAPELNAAAGDKSEEQAKGRIRGEHELRGDKAETAGVVAGEIASAQAPYLATKPLTPEQIADNTRADKALDETVKSRKIAQATRDDAAKERKSTSDRGWITEYGNKHIKQIDTAKLVDELDDIIASAESSGDKPAGLGVEQLKDGVGKYPLGQTGRAIAALVGSDEYNDFQNKADYNRKLVNRIGESVYRIDTGASGNEREEMRAAIANALKPTATLDDIKNSSKILRMRLSSQLGNSAAAAPDLASQSLAGGGISDPSRWISAPQRASAAPQVDPELSDGQSLVVNEDGEEVVEGAGAEGSFETPQPPASRRNGNRPARNSNTTQPTNLGVNNGASKINAGAHAAGTPPKREVTITYDDGTSEMADLSDMEIARLRGKRGVVEVR